MNKIWLLLLPLWSGCVDSQIEPGLNLHQLEYKVKKSEAFYIKEMEYIFSNYELVLYDIQKTRAYTFFYLVERNGNFKLDSYYNEVKPRLYEKGWFLVKKDDFGELYCNEKNQAIGITFPTDKLELDGVNTGYFTYQFFQKVSITLQYTTNNKSVSCPNNKESNIKA